jgi:fatty acid desaturase
MALPAGSTVPVLDPGPVSALDPACDLAPRGSDFARLAQRVTAAGLMRRRPGYYAVKIAATVALYAAAWAAFVLVGVGWWQLAVAAGLGIAYTQLAYLGHDAAHRQMFRTRRASEFAGLLIGNLGVGMSLGWWTTKHNRHHANPNHEDLDPDVGVGALVWTMRQAATRRNRLTRWLTAHQGTLFFPLLTLEGLNLHVTGAVEIAREPMRNRRAEASLLIAHVVLYLAAVFIVLPVGLGFAFIAVHQAVFGLYMGSAFAPNHKGMPVLSEADELDFLRKQVLTSRNVKGGRFVDFALGGLNYQIEHHLFPSMARANLRHAQPIVAAFCAEIGVPYLESGLISSYRQALSYLNEVGQGALAG